MVDAWFEEGTEAASSAGCPYSVPYIPLTDDARSVAILNEDGSDKMVGDV